MEQRVSLITLATNDIAGLATFYEALGWQRVDSPDGVIAFDLIGQTLGLYPRADLAKEMGVNPDELGRGAIVLSHNVGAKGDVAPLLDRAIRAGGHLLKPAQDVIWGGYHGYFSDPQGHIWEIAWNPFSPLGPRGEFQWNGAR